MKKHIGYNWRFYKIVEQFLQDERLDILEHCLKDMEEDMRERFNYSENQSLWFRLFDGDNVVTNINTIKADYKGAYKKYLMQNLKDCIQGASVQIYFS